MRRGRPRRRIPYDMARHFIVEHSILIHAPIERCFALSTSIPLVQRILGMRPVHGRTAGFVTAGDTVLWRGWQLGLPQFHESLIEPFERPTYFRDSMVRGRFRTFHHDHRFVPQSDGSTLLADQVHFSLPFGLPGAVVGRFLLLPHVRRLLRRRFALLKELAEGSGWQRYLPA